MAMPSQPAGDFPALLLNLRKLGSTAEMLYRLTSVMRSALVKLSYRLNRNRNAEGCTPPCLMRGRQYEPRSPRDTSVAAMRLLVEELLTRRFIKSPSLEAITKRLNTQAVRRDLRSRQA